MNKSVRPGVLFERIEQSRSLNHPATRETVGCLAAVETMLAIFYPVCGFLWFRS